MPPFTLDTHALQEDRSQHHSVCTYLNIYTAAGDLDLSEHDDESKGSELRRPGGPELTSEPDLALHR